MTSDPPILFIGSSEQIEEWLAWPGRVDQPEGDTLVLDDYMDRGVRPPRAFDQYGALVFWYTREGRASRDPAYLRANMVREGISHREGLNGMPTRMALFAPVEERAIEAEAAKTEETARVAPSIRLAELARDRYEYRKADGLAEDQLAAEALAAVVGERTKQTAREFALTPKPQAVMQEVLAAEVNLLAGPGAAGKSLLTRDWALCVASGQPWRGYAVPEQRNVLLMLSEGTHDFAERYQSHPLWEAAADHVWVIDQPVDMVHGDDAGWLLKEYATERPGLVVLDIVYSFGLSDDNGSKDALPLLSSLKRVSAEWGAATLAVGHPPHGDERRFRGTSMWRQLAYTDWFLGDGMLTCGKSKIGHAAGMSAPYAAEYPTLRWLSVGESLATEAGRTAVIEASVTADPSVSVRARAVRLAGDLGLSEDRARKLITAYLKAARGMS